MTSVARTDTPKRDGCFTAIVLAGERTRSDPVAQAAGVPCKALAPVGGVPMVIRVLDALGDSDWIDTRILCGPARAVVEQDGDLRALIHKGTVTWLEPGTAPSTSAHAAMQTVAAGTPVLLTTADHALLDSELVDYFCDKAVHSGCDVVAAVADAGVVQAAYPGVRRTVIALRDGAYSGCNLFAFLTPQARQAARFWRRVEAQRKNPLRLIGHMGWMTALRYALGALTLDDALARLSRRMGVHAGTVTLPYPRAAIDVDRVSDWRFVNQEIDKPTRQGHGRARRTR